MNTDYDILISKYLAGEVSADEIVALENWVQESVENKDKFNQYKNTWHLLQPNTSIEVEAAWKKVASNLFPEVKVIDIHRKRNSFPILKVAAAVLLLVTAGLWLFNPDKNIATKSLVAGNTANIFQLNDGTEVTLNRNSKIEYVKGFNGKERKVSLTGDAFFNVKRNEEKPFIIATQNIEVAVLGTSFYVDSHEENPTIEVTVASGKVSVSTKEEEVILTIGEKGIFNKETGMLIEILNNDPNYLSWKTKQMTFDDVPLGQVIDKINEVYHADIQFENTKLKNCTITAAFNQQSLHEVLEVISKTLDIQAEEQEQKILLKGKGCQ